jgi:gliding motility-associated-like protein
MRKRYYILFFFFTSILVTCNVGAQYADVVCAGAARVYKITPNPGSTYTWMVIGDSITYEYGDSIGVIWGNKAGIYTVQVSEKSSFGCSGSPVTAYVKISVPSINLGGVIRICEGQSAVLDAGQGYPKYQWNNGNTKQQIEVKTAGYYKVEVTDSIGCQLSDSVEVSFSPKPKVDLGPDTMLCGDESVQLDAGPDGVKYDWSNNRTERTYIISAKDIPYISVLVTNADGCTSSDTVMIWPCDYAKLMSKVPNTITPNGDGKNDTWRIWFLVYFPDAKVQIFDRWGQIVYQSNHGLPDNGWDGTSNGRKLPMDSYFYIIDLHNVYGPLSGTISIVR